MPSDGRGLPRSLRYALCGRCIQGFRILLALRKPSRPRGRRRPRRLLAASHTCAFRLGGPSRPPGDTAAGAARESAAARRKRLSAADPIVYLLRSCIVRRSRHFFHVRHGLRLDGTSVRTKHLPETDIQDDASSQSEAARVSGTHSEDPNLAFIVQILSAGSAESIFAQSYLPESRAGDKRVIVLDGEPVGAVLRGARRDDVRCNFAAGERRTRDRGRRRQAGSRPANPPAGGSDVRGFHRWSTNDRCVRWLLNEWIPLGSLRATTGREGRHQGRHCRGAGRGRLPITHQDR